MNDMPILPDRKCGQVKEGALYLGSGMSPSGTYESCTVLAYAHPADVLNARAPVAIGLAATFDNNRAGAFAAPGGSTPAWKNFRRGLGLLDLWGASYYKEAYDALLETRMAGPNRRISPQTLKMVAGQLPIPIFMQHVRGMVSTTHPDGWDGVAEALYKLGDFEYWTNPENRDGWDLAPMVEAQPWRAAESLGRVGDPTYWDHPYTEFLAILTELRDKGKLSKLTRDAQLVFEPGIVGLTWATRVLYVLPEGEDEVPEEYAAYGARPAIGEHDSRASID